MNIAVVSGSHRPQSQSGKVARFVVDRLHMLGLNPYLLDLGRTPIPVWNEDIWSQGVETWDPTWRDVSARLKNVDGLVIVSPEWSGMVPPLLKNFFLLCSNGELSHKPALIVGVTSGRSGSYPVAELRMSSYKNTKICYLPEHNIIRDVEHVLNGMASTSTDDSETRKRLDYSLELLTLYAKALKPIRAEAIVAESPYPFGM
jgi:NAD(P)H-dependent FMN reductase